MLTRSTYRAARQKCSLPCLTRPQGVYVVVSSQTSSAVTVSYDPPSLTAVSPANGPTLGGTLITLSGNNFGFAPTATIGGSSCNVTSSNHTVLVCRLPAGETAAGAGAAHTCTGMGAGLQALVTLLGRVSTSQSFSYDAPVLSVVSPTAFDTVGGTTLTINGTNFGSHRSRARAQGALLTWAVQAHLVW